MLQNATPLRKSAPWPPNISDEHVSCTAPATRKCIFADPLQMSHACHRFWKCHKTLTFCSLLTRCTIPCACQRKTTSERPNGVHFFDISTSKSGPRPGVFCTFWLRNVLRATTACTFSTSQLPKVVRTLVCFVHFDFEICFVPQRRALFRHLNFQKWSENGVFCTFWLRNVLRATTACTFSSLIWPAGSAPAALASLLFDPPEPQIIGKTQCFATFLPFRASASSFFWLFLFSDLLSSNLALLSASCPCSAFHLFIVSEVWLLNFLRWLLMAITTQSVVNNPMPDHLQNHRKWVLKNIPNITFIGIHWVYQCHSITWKIWKSMGRIIPYTSSTAQGGGGSFKNRKPIGKVGCCESRMGERSHWWIERWLMSPLFLFLSLSLSLIIYLPTYLAT